jgi:hypothetical protein
MQELTPEGNTGIVRVMVGNGSRTLMPPALPPISSYRFIFESREESPQKATVVRDSTDPSLELELTVGAWSLTVTALAETGSGVKEIARGSASLLVFENITNSVTVQLGNEPGDEPGVLRYTVEFPDSVTAALLSLVSMNGGENPAPVDLLAGSTVSGSVKIKTGVLNAAAGTYLLNVDLYGSAGNAGKTEVVHIYSNTETEAPAVAYDFSSVPFSSTTEYQTGSGQSLSNVLTAIGTASGTDFTIILNQDEPAFAPFTLDAVSFGGKKVRIRGRGHTVTRNGRDTLFTLETGAVLVLQDLEMNGQGPENFNYVLIRVTGGDLLINPGTVITGNSHPYDTNLGGGVYVDDGTLIMNGGSISGNSANSGGGVYIENGTFIMNGGSISSNSATSPGGGVYVGGGTFAMSGGSISGNFGHNSGGVYIENGTFTMSGGSISNNSTYAGAGVSVRNGTFTMSGGTISGNSSSYSGGGVIVSDSTFTMSGGTISGNSSPSSFSSSGGGVSVSNGIFTMSGGTISGNSVSPFSPSNAYGGGVYVQGSSSTFTMNGGTVSGNSVSSSSLPGVYGGGVYVGNGTFAMNGGSISGNSVSTSSLYVIEGGGVIVTNSGIFTMSGGIISGNSSSYGGGVQMVADTFAMGNNARIDPSNEVCLYYAGSSSITLIGGFNGSDTIAVIDLRGGAADWLGKSVLVRDAGYTGTIPADRFILGNFVSSDYTKTPITTYVINSEGRLVDK